MAVQQHQSDPRILNRRTLEHDHPHLVPLLRPGMRVLDIGCGTGAITADIARAVGPQGAVVGLDRDSANLEIARQEHAAVPNLSFQAGDILAPDFATSIDAPFDLVNATRVLLWIGEPVHALQQMKKVVRPVGRIVALDYSLDDTEWDPEPPSSFCDFYRAFLQFRSSNGWDNSMARHLPAVFGAAGLTDIQTHRCDEVVRRGDPNFAHENRSRIWLYVIDSVGAKVVKDGFLDGERVALAREEYEQYVTADMKRQSLFTVTVDGIVPESA